MKNFPISILAVAAIGFSGMLISSYGQGFPVSGPDYQQLVSTADLVYNQPVKRSEAGMPVGNGHMGSLVWTSPTSMKFQLNRVDVFANNSASNSFYERHTDYCNGVGFVDIDFVDFGEDVFTDEDFRQQLSCYEGVISTEGKGIKTEALAWHEQDVIAVKVEDNRQNPVAININLRMLREAVAKKGNHSAISELKLADGKIVLTQTFKEDNFYCASAVVIGVSDRDSKTRLPNESEAQLSVEPGNGSFTVYTASAASFDTSVNVVEKAILQLEAARKKGFEALYASNKAWWKDFWSKSHLQLQSNDGKAALIQQHYYYYLYVMASSSRGSYPAKFNGMLWNTGGDARKWGALYWGANQSCLYNALFPTNHIELMDPMFNMYSLAYGAMEEAADQQWGSKGVFIPETMSFDGFSAMPESIAAEMRELYLNRKKWDDRSAEFETYARTKLPFHSRWNWKKDEGWKEGVWRISHKGSGQFGHVTHIFSRGAKLAYQYWQRYEYTQDENWLRERAYPMIRGVAEFYHHFPNLKKEADGKYHIRYVNDNESVWAGHNTHEEISSMMAILLVAIKAAEILKTDAPLRQEWQEIFDNLSPLPESTSDNGTDNSRVTWIKSLQPVEHGNSGALPDGNTMPMWFFDLCTLESTDSTRMQIARNTFDAFFPNGLNEETPVYVLSKLAAAGTLLGRQDAARYLIPNQIKTAEIEVLPNRMDLREGFQTNSIQRLGRAADALHNALCQSVPPSPGKDPVIRLFPAWPGEWDASFKLLCRGGFLVSTSMQGGKITFVGIESQAGGTCRIRNPWPGSEVLLVKNGKATGELQGDLLVITSKKGDVLELKPR